NMVLGAINRLVGPFLGPFNEFSATRKAMARGFGFTAVNGKKIVRYNNRVAMSIGAYMVQDIAPIKGPELKSDLPVEQWPTKMAKRYGECLKTGGELDDNGRNCFNRYNKMSFADYDGSN